MIYTEGQSARLTEVFLDESDDPLDYNDSSPPVVTLLKKKKIITEAYASPDSSAGPGTWVVDLPIPNLDLTEVTRFTVMWRFVDVDGNVHSARDHIEVSPETEQRIGDITFLANFETKATAILPFVFKEEIPDKPADLINQIPAQPGTPGDEIEVALFNENTLLYQQPLDATSTDLRIKPGSKTTSLTFPVIWATTFFQSMTLNVKHTAPERMPINYVFNVWPSNPSILNSTKQLEEFLNKAHIKNVIPELDYTQGDLMMYLSRGLSLFNALEQITAFTGMNMTGYMQEAWLICAAYYALAAQLQAEGALAFDFSGQTVSLNIDRTPSIESALGRVENQIENVVRPLKKRLAQAGITSGDGSIGNKPLNAARSRGVLGLTNAPTTRLPYSGRSGSWFRPMF